jgi:anthranilate phosphoribosyltransferase
VLAATLRDLGVERAWVVRGADGMDELSPFGPTMITSVEAGSVREFRLTPEDFGLTASPEGATDGADAEHNARVLGQVLDGAAHPSRDAFLLNAAGALCVYDGVTPPEALQRARTAVASGQARAKLDEWTRVSREE